MKISKPIIFYAWTILDPCGLNPWTFRDFEDTLGIFTMYQVIPRVSIQATIVDLYQMRASTLIERLDMSLGYN